MGTFFNRLFGALPEMLLFPLLCERVFALSDKLVNKEDVQKNEQESKDEPSDSVAAADEHHRIVILVPQIIRQEKKKPKSHHHPKVVPVVHSGKVIHAHHHHGTVDHKHAHDGKAKHDHKHAGAAGHKHSHYGVGTVTHKHSGKGSHEHKHEGKGEYKHAHSGKGSIHHLHSKHHHHHHHHPKPPTKKFANPFYGLGGGSENYVASDGSRVRIDAELLRALNPAAAPLSSSFIGGAGGARIIQIRIPEENDADVDTQSDLLKKNYITFGEGTDGVEFIGNLDDAGDAGEENEETDGESEYQLGDGYKLAASAAARAQVSAEDGAGMLTFTANDAVDPFLPAVTKNNVVAYSDAYHYQF